MGGRCCWPSRRWPGSGCCGCCSPCSAARPLVLALLAGYLAYVFTLLGRPLVGGRHQPAAAADRPGLRAARARGLPAAPADPPPGRRARLDRRPACSSTRRRCCCFGVYAIVGFGWFCTGRHAAPAPAPVVPLPRRRGRLRRARRRLPRALRAVRPELLPRQRSTQPWSPIAYDLVGTTLLPGLVGGPLTGSRSPSAPSADPTQVIQLVSWVAFVALVVHAHRTRTMSRRAWSPLAFTAAATSRCSPRRAPTWSAPTSPASTATRPSPAALFVLWPSGWPSCRCVGAPRGQNAVPRTCPHPRATRAWSPPSTVAVVRRGAGLEHCATSTCGRTGNPTEPYFATSAARLASRARQAGAAGRPRHPADAAVGLPLPGELLLPRLPEPRRTRPPTRARRWTGCTCSTTRAASPPSASRRPGPDGPARAAATRSRATARPIPLDGPVIGGGWWLQIGYAEPARPCRCRSRPARRCTTSTCPRGCTTSSCRPPASSTR